MTHSMIHRKLYAINSVGHIYRIESREDFGADLRSRWNLRLIAGLYSSGFGKYQEFELRSADFFAEDIQTRSIVQDIYAEGTYEAFENNGFRILQHKDIYNLFEHAFNAITGALI